MQNKRKIIYILITAVVTLLLINVVLGFVNIKLPDNKPKTLSKNVIEGKFKKVLIDYGIEEGWIKNGKIQKGDLVVIDALGAGLSWGSALIKW